MNSDELLNLQDFGTAIAEDLLGLAQLHARELDSETLAALHQVNYPQGIALQLLSKKSLDAAKGLQQALQTQDKIPTESIINTLAADYAGIYLNHYFKASPCESVWSDADGLTHQEAMFSIRNWYRRHHLRVADWRICSDDHLVSQLQFIAHLLSHSNTQDITTWSEANKFMNTHLLTWLAKFSEQVSTHCETPFYSALADFTLCYLQELSVTLKNIIVYENEITGQAV